MYYLDLRVSIFEGNREKLLKIGEKEQDRLLRDIVADNLHSLITSEKNDNKSIMNQAPYKAKTFVLEDHKQLYKFKDKILYSDDEVIEVSDNLFKFIESNFKPDIADASMNALVVGLADMIEQAKNPEGGEEKAEKDYKAYQSKKPKPITARKFYEHLGYKIEIVPIKKAEDTNAA